MQHSNRHGSRPRNRRGQHGPTARKPGCSRCVLRGRLTSSPSGYSQDGGKMSTLEPGKTANDANQNAGVEPAPTQAALEVQAIEAGYGHAQILNGVSLKLEARQLVSVVGPNGAGKSTLMKAIFGLLRVSSGRVFLEGKDKIGRASCRER